MFRFENFISSLTQHAMTPTAKSADPRLAAAEKRIRELEAREAERERRLEAELSKLRVPEVSASALKLLSPKDQPLGQGGFKKAWLCEWKGNQVVKLEFLAPVCS